MDASRQLTIKAGVVTRCVRFPMHAPVDRSHLCCRKLTQVPADIPHRPARQAIHRLHKELQVYRDEADKTRSTIEQMEKAAADEYEIRQQVGGSFSPPGIARTLT